jgi:hypothetical protein
MDLVVVAGPVNSHAAIAARLEGDRRLVGLRHHPLPPPWVRSPLMPLVTRLADVVMTTGLKSPASMLDGSHPGTLA